MHIQIIVSFNVTYLIIHCILTYQYNQLSEKLNKKILYRHYKMFSMFKFTVDICTEFFYDISSGYTAHEIFNSGPFYFSWTLYYFIIHRILT